MMHFRWIFRQKSADSRPDIAGHRAMSEAFLGIGAHQWGDRNILARSYNLPMSPPMFCIAHWSSTYRTRSHWCSADNRPMSFASVGIGGDIFGTRHRPIIGRYPTVHWSIINRYVTISAGHRMNIVRWSAISSRCPANFRPLPAATPA